MENPNLPTAKEEVPEEPQCLSFGHLKAVRMSNFKGTNWEMELVWFPLGKAPNLASLVLVAPPRPVSDEDYQKLIKYSIPESRIVREVDLKSLYMRLLLLPKASSHAQIVVTECSEDERTLNPTHTTLYCDVKLVQFRI